MACLVAGEPSNIGRRDEADPKAGAGVGSQGKGARRGGRAPRPKKKAGGLLLGGRGRRHRRGQREVILRLIAEAKTNGARLESACEVAGISIRSIERWRAKPDGDDERRGPRHQPGNALSAIEQQQVLAVMTSERYVGLSPKQLVPQLADEGLYLASESTMYRLQRRVGLRKKKLCTERTHAARPKMVHRATGANQVWSWDITWLPTNVCGRFLFLYLVMDVWSRRIVGWT